MTIDPRNLRPGELCRLLNSTRLGEVIAERQLLRHRTRAGLQLGEGKRIDLLRYTAWLLQSRHYDAPKESEEASYERLKEKARSRNVLLSVAGRDIGEMPPVEDPERKQRAALDFRYFCEAYFPHTFHLEWSADHLKVIAKIEEAVLRGGLFAMAMPRGSGKTTICECACIWASFFGHHPFLCLIGSDEGHACGMLDSIKHELESNDLLLEDFPEVVYPIHCLDGISNRCKGQLYLGKRTHIGWTAKEIVLPTVPGSVASSALIKVAGITGGIRGMKAKRSDGKTVRPSLVILDDPQTDQSARSLSQCATREGILAGAILGLAGPGKKISGIMPCTVIRPGDMADNILDKEKHAEWNGERTKMVYAFPTNDELWKRYAELRGESLRKGRRGEDATEFYRENQAAMDEGAEVAWPERFNTDELSAIQHAMNLKLRDEAAFYAEYQNEPLLEKQLGAEELTVDQICEKVNRLKRGEIPISCTHLTAFIDVQQNLLFYLVAAWEDRFTGYVIDYGTYPDQQRQYFTLRDAHLTISEATRLTSLESFLYKGLENLTLDILGREWSRDDGAQLRIERCLIDANWGATTDLIYQFCRQSAYASVVLPSHGKFVGASSKPMSEYTKHPGDKIGHNWRMPNVAGKRAVRHVTYDTNYWKTFVHSRLAVPMGDTGCLSLFGGEPDRHRLLAEHLTAEYRVKTAGYGRVVDEWKNRPTQNDNHWLDCLVGSAVAASMVGVALPNFQEPLRGPRPTARTLMEMAKEAERRR